MVVRVAILSIAELGKYVGESRAGRTNTSARDQRDEGIDDFCKLVARYATLSRLY